MNLRKHNYTSVIHLLDVYLCLLNCLLDRSIAEAALPTLQTSRKRFSLASNGMRGGVEERRGRGRGGRGGEKEEGELEWDTRECGLPEKENSLNTSDYNNFQPLSSFNWSPESALKQQALRDKPSQRFLKPPDQGRPTHFARYDVPVPFSSKQLGYDGTHLPVSLSARVQRGHYSHPQYHLASATRSEEGGVQYHGNRRRSKRGGGLPGVVSSPGFYSATTMPGSDALQYSRHGDGVQGLPSTEVSDVRVGGGTRAPPTSGREWRQCTTSSVATG